VHRPGRGTIKAGEVGISATNRNFEGRMGDKNGLVYLGSPAVVAASAVAGYICSPTKFTPTRKPVHVRPQRPPPAASRRGRSGAKIVRDHPGFPASSWPSTDRVDARRRHRQRRHGRRPHRPRRHEVRRRVRPCDIGWEFWCKEGNALPDRTIKALEGTTCGLFGAITSKPQDDAKLELAPELKDKKLVYFSPIVKLRQMFNLHTNMRPCKSYPGNPLNYRGTRLANPSGEATSPSTRSSSARTPRACTAASSSTRCPNPSTTPCALNPKMKPWKDKGLENVALSTRIVSVQGCTSICRQAFEYAKKTAASASRSSKSPTSSARPAG
jgi:hypothetical protein